MFFQTFNNTESKIDDYTSCYSSWSKMTSGGKYTSVDVTFVQQNS